MAVHHNRQLEIDHLVSIALESNASDLHLLSGKPPIIRVDGTLHPLDEFPVFDADELEKIIGVLLNEQLKTRLEEYKHVDFSYNPKGSSRFRVNVYYQKGTLAAALRQIPPKIRTLEELGLPGQLEEYTKEKQGLFLVVGPTGHGKSTTLAALIDIINHSENYHIITIEDPIEYIFPQDKSVISQREVFIDTPNFASAIRATLREDADVVMVGEMRDLDSIQNTITVAETGHLVFATLHTNDAGQSIDRIVDVFPAHQQNQIRSQLANILLGIVSQRLIPRIGGGRIPAVEIMSSNTAVQNIIREGRTYELPNTINTSSKDGMVSLDNSIAMLVKKGLVKMEDGMRYSRNLEVFKSLMKRY